MCSYWDPSAAPATVGYAVLADGAISPATTAPTARIFTYVDFVITSSAFRRPDAGTACHSARGVCPRQEARVPVTRDIVMADRDICPMTPTAWWRTIGREVVA